MKTIFNKLSVAYMYIQVTQYDTIQRATAGHKFVLFGIRYIN